MAISKQVAVLLVVVLIIGACSGDYNGKGGGGKRQGGRRRGNISGLSRCYLSGGYPCYGSGLSVRCYYDFQACDGYNHCPYGDDEYICDDVITPTRTVYITRTSTRTATRTSTSTTSTTSSTSTTTTTTSTETTTSTSTQSLGALLPFDASSSTYTTSFTTTYSFLGLSAVGLNNPIPENAVFCTNLVAIGTVAADVGRVSANTVTPVVSFTATASVSCTPTTTIYTTIS